MNIAFNPSAWMALTFSQGNSPLLSYSAAFGAIVSRASARTLSRSMRSSSENATVASMRAKIVMPGGIASMRDPLPAVDVNRLAGEERNVLGEEGRDEPRDLLSRSWTPAWDALVDVVAHRSALQRFAIEVGDDVSRRDVEHAYAFRRPFDRETARHRTHRSLRGAVGEIALHANLVEERADVHDRRTRCLDEV